MTTPASYLLALVQAYGKTPVVLVELVRGAATYRYVLAKKDYAWGGFTWRASPLDFDELNYSDEIKKDDFTLKNLLKNDPDYSDLREESDTELKLTLRRGFVGIEGFIVVYKGSLSTFIPHKNSVDMVFSSWSKSLARRAAGNVAMRQCALRLYSEDCGVVRADFATAGTATAFAGVIVTVAAAGGEADGYFTGGMIEFGGDRRMIVKHVGTAVTLGGSFTNLAQAIGGAGSASIVLYPGCDKSATTCRDRFNNIEHHLGFALMSDNPFTTRMN